MLYRYKKDKKVKKRKNKLERKAEKIREKYRKGEFGGDINEDEDMGFDEILDEGEDIEEIGYVSLSDTDNEIERQGFSVTQEDREASSSGDDDKRISKMNEEMEEQYMKKIEESTLKRNIKNKRLDKKVAKKFEEDKDSEEEMEDESEEAEEKNDNETDVFINPLKGKINKILEDEEIPPLEGKSKKRKKPEKDEKSESEDDEPMGIKKEKSERDLRKEKKKKQRERLEREGKIHNSGFEEVAQEFDENMDSDDIAETVAIAKMMLRKKNRESLIDSSYNRYVFDEDKSELPIWFADDEEKYNKAPLPIPKEMIEAEKNRLREFNEKTPKKVLEVRARKRNKIARKLEKLKQKEIGRASCRERVSPPV